MYMYSTIWRFAWDMGQHPDFPLILQRKIPVPGKKPVRDAWDRQWSEFSSRAGERIALLVPTERRWPLRMSC